MNDEQQYSQTHVNYVRWKKFDTDRRNPFCPVCGVRLYIYAVRDDGEMLTCMKGIGGCGRRYFVDD
jgi:hypothetical protein